MQKLYVLYDPKCELCCRLKNWILVQRSWIGLALVEQARRRRSGCFRNSRRIATKEDLAVISDEGAVYLNDRAWIMVLYAMVEYRDWAARLTHPLLMPLARQAFAALSKNRHISRWLSSEDPEASPANCARSNSSLAPCRKHARRCRTSGSSYNDEDDRHNAQDRGPRRARKIPAAKSTKPRWNCSAKKVSTRPPCATSRPKPAWPSAAPTTTSPPKTPSCSPSTARCRRTATQPVLEALAGHKKLKDRIRRVLEQRLALLAPNRKFCAALFRHAPDGADPLSPFSDETRPIREGAIEHMRIALEGSDAKIPADLKPRLPYLLWLYQMALIMFWLYDRSPNQERTERCSIKAWACW